MGRLTVLVADDFEEVSKRFSGYKNLGFDYINRIFVKFF